MPTDREVFERIFNPDMSLRAEPNPDRALNAKFCTVGRTGDLNLLFVWFDENGDEVQHCIVPRVAEQGLLVALANGIQALNFQRTHRN